MNKACTVHGDGVAARGLVCGTSPYSRGLQLTPELITYYLCSHTSPPPDQTPPHNIQSTILLITLQNANNINIMSEILRYDFLNFQSRLYGVFW